MHAGQAIGRSLAVNAALQLMLQIVAALPLTEVLWAPDANAVQAAAESMGDEGDEDLTVADDASQVRQWERAHRATALRQAAGDSCCTGSGKDSFAASSW